LVFKLLLHTLDGGFGSGQFKNAAESSGLWLVCDGCGADMVGVGLDIDAHGCFGLRHGLELGWKHHWTWTWRITRLVGIIMKEMNIKD
jgi:hypothetical protein